MRFRLLPLLAVLVPAVAAAQPEVTGLTSERPPAVVSVSMLYQAYEHEDNRIAELAFPVSVFVPAGQRLSLRLTASPAHVTGEGLVGGTAPGELAGLGDVQASAAYAQPVGRGTVVLNLGLNLPSGKQELTREELATSLLLSQNYYDFNLPSLGQGFNVSPGVTFAFPVGDGVALGVGAAYQLRGSFTPVEGLGAYDPGDEILLTGGADVRLGEAASLSADVTYTAYGTDRLDGRDVFGSGDKVTAVLLYRQFLGFDELRLLGRYRSRGKNEAAHGGVLVEAGEWTIPTQLEVSGSYRMRLGTSLWGTILAAGRFFDATDQFEAEQMIDLGLQPEVRLTPGLGLMARFVYTLGGVSGFEAGGGLTMRM